TLRFALREPHPARQPRPRIARKPCRWAVHQWFSGTKTPSGTCFGSTGVMERIEHRPQHAAFEFKRRKHRLLLRGRIGVALDVAEREIGVPLGLRRTLVEIA